MQTRNGIEGEKSPFLRVPSLFIFVLIDATRNGIEGEKLPSLLKAH